MSSPPFTLFEDAEMVVDGGPLGTGSEEKQGKWEGICEYTIKNKACSK